VSDVLTHFELTVGDLDENEAAWLGRMYEKDGGDSYLATFTDGPDGLSVFFHSEGYGDPIALAETLRDFLRLFRPTAVLGLTWSTTSDDGYSGGAVAISSRTVRRQTLDLWLRVARDDMALVFRREYLALTGHETPDEWARCSGYVQHSESGDWYREGDLGWPGAEPVDPWPELDREVAKATAARLEAIL
jgi:hypothetical protein